MIWLEDLAQLDEAMTSGPQIVYKHSPTCGLSARAAAQIAEVERVRSDVPLYAVDVIHHQEISRALAVRLEVGHESPQVFVVQEGQVRWHASHHRVTAVSILEALALIDPGQTESVVRLNG